MLLILSTIRCYLKDQRNRAREALKKLENAGPRVVYELLKSLDVVECFSPFFMQVIATWKLGVIGVSFHRLLRGLNINKVFL